MSVKIKKIKIDIDGKVLELTKRQAIQLKEILEDMYDKDKTIYIDRYPYWPTRWAYDQWIYTSDNIKDVLWLSSTPNFEGNYATS